MIKFAAAGTLAAAALAICGAAQASDGLKLSYKDLDLGRPKDAHTFRLRMETAAAYMCRAEISTGSHSGGRSLCEARTRNDMLASMPAETRSVYQAALNGRASDRLAQARAAASAASGSAVTATVAPPN